MPIIGTSNKLRRCGPLEGSLGSVSREGTLQQSVILTGSEWYDLCLSGRSTLELWAAPSNGASDKLVMCGPWEDTGNKVHGGNH